MPKSQGLFVFRIVLCRCIKLMSVCMKIKVILQKRRNKDMRKILWAWVYKTTFSESMNWDKSFIYNRNNIGHKIEPWGTPLLLSAIDEWNVILLSVTVLEICTACFLLLKYNKNQSQDTLLIQCWYGFVNKVTWCTLSNALEKSINTPIAYWLLF